MKNIKKLLKKIKLVDAVSVMICALLLIMAINTVETNKKREEVYSNMIESYKSVLVINQEQEEVIYDLQELVVELLNKLKESK